MLVIVTAVDVDSIQFVWMAALFTLKVSESHIALRVVSDEAFVVR